MTVRQVPTLHSRAAPRRRLHDFEIMEFDATTLQNGLLDIKSYADKVLKADNVEHEHALREIIRMANATIMGLEEDKAIFHDELKKVVDEVAGK